MSGGPELPRGYEPRADAFDRWREVAPGVLVRRHRVLDLNVTLVLGEDRALVVDTHMHDGHARALIGAVRELTGLPWVVLDTHAHFDHSFGNATFAREQRPLEIWGHEGCRRSLERFGPLQRKRAAQDLRDAGRPDERGCPSPGPPAHHEQTGRARPRPRQERGEARAPGVQ